MKKLICLLLACLLCGLPALAEQALQAGDFKAPRDTALSMIDMLNTGFADYEGSIVFDQIVDDAEEGITFFSSESSVGCVMEYGEAGVGIGLVRFITGTQNLTMCLSLAYGIVDEYLGGSQELIDWLGGTCIEELNESLQATGEGQVVFPLTGADFVISAFYQEDMLVCTVDVDTEYALVQWN